VADGDEMLNESMRPGCIVADDQVAIDVGQRAIHQDEGKPAPQQRQDASARPIARGSEEETLDAVGNQVLDVFALIVWTAPALAVSGSQASNSKYKQISMTMPPWETGRSHPSWSAS
jgi:hypothetical protein